MTDISHFTAEDGARLAYCDQGSGLAFLCLPGLTRTMADFDYLIPHLPPLRLIRMDYRGRGGSDWTGAATYTVDQEARDALALLDHLGVAKVAILGTSRGGLIGMVLGAVARDRVLQGEVERNLSTVPVEGCRQPPEGTCEIRVVARRCLQS